MDPSSINSDADPLPQEMCHKVKVSIYCNLYFPTFFYGHELWVVTERTRCQVQAAEISRKIEDLRHVGEARSRAVAPLL